MKRAKTPCRRGRRYRAVVGGTLRAGPPAGPSTRYIGRPWLAARRRWRSATGDHRARSCTSIPLARHVLTVQPADAGDAWTPGVPAWIDRRPRLGPTPTTLSNVNG